MIYGRRLHKMKLEMGLRSYCDAHQKVHYFGFLCYTVCEIFLTMEHDGKFMHAVTNTPHIFRLLE
jgi:hypothetical protein